MVPSKDRTDGLITFEAEDAKRAGCAVDMDPFQLDVLLQAYWLEQWTPE